MRRLALCYLTQHSVPIADVDQTPSQSESGRYQATFPATVVVTVTVVRPSGSGEEAKADTRADEAPTEGETAVDKPTSNKRSADKPASNARSNDKPASNARSNDKPASNARSCCEPRATEPRACDARPAADPRAADPRACDARAAAEPRPTDPRTAQAPAAHPRAAAKMCSAAAHSAVRAALGLYACRHCRRGEHHGRGNGQYGLVHSSSFGE
jgi:hypothetical protein